MANEKRLIDANALDFDFPVTDDLIEMGIEMVRARVVTAPTVDAVEVVRCKDCRYYTEKTKRCDHQCLEWDVECYDLWLEMEPGDFCSYGERREGE